MVFNHASGCPQSSSLAHSCPGSAACTLLAPCLLCTALCVQANTHAAANECAEQLYLVTFHVGSVPHMLTRAVCSVLGEVRQRWHLWQRNYELFLGKRQFAAINGGFLAWEFVLKDEQGGEQYCRLLLLLSGLTWLAACAAAKQVCKPLCASVRAAGKPHAGIGCSNGFVSATGVNCVLRQVCWRSSTATFRALARSSSLTLARCGHLCCCGWTCSHALQLSGLWSSISSCSCVAGGVRQRRHAAYSCN